VVGLIAVGVVAAASAAVLVMAMRTSGRGHTEPVKPPEDIKLFVAGKPLKAMATIDAKSIIEKTLPREQAPEGCITSHVKILGKVIASDMVKGQAFTPACFVTEGSARKLAASLGDMQAFPISVPDRLKNLLYPGSVVDVLASLDRPSDTEGVSEEAFCVTLLERILVLGVNDDTIVSEEKDNGAKGARSQYGRKMDVSLKVTPAQTRELHLAATRGSLSLSVRDPLNEASSKQGVTYLSDLSDQLVRRPMRVAVAAGQESGAKQPPDGESPARQDVSPPRIQAPARWQIQVIRGTRTAKVSFTYPEESGNS